MKRVLIADDNAVSRELIREILEAVGHEVIEASEGREALAKIRESGVDLVLLDIQMPGTDGYAVLQQIHSDPQLRSIRVLALTAYAMPKDRARALASGFDGFITKPVDAALLREEVERRVRANRSRGACA